MRISVFISLLSFMFCLEFLFKARNPKLKKGNRWLSHIILVIISSLLLRLLFPFAVVGISIWAQENGIGVLNFLYEKTEKGSSTFAFFSIITSLLILDLIIYWQHRIFHKFQMLWKLHSTHHSDIDLDASTAIRFHPIEILISFWVKGLAIALIGAPVTAVILFEIILNGMAIFNHSNIRIPSKMETFLRLFIVSPDMHAIHHSVKYEEHNSNFGFCLSFWDRIFSSYNHRPHASLVIGLPKQVQSNQPMNIKDLLAFPFKR